MKIAPLAACLLAAAVARADSSPDGPTQGAGRARLAPLLPTVRLSGSTAGDGIIQASLDLIVGIANDWDLAITPTYLGSSPAGLSQLFSSDNNTGAVKPWALGASITFIKLGVDPSNELPGAGGPTDEVKKRAYDVCMDRCRSDSASDDDRRFCTENVHLSPFEVDPQRLCAKGQAVFLQKDVLVREKRAAFPQLAISLGALAGSTHFNYFSINSDRQLMPQDETHVDYSVAGSLTYVRRNTGFTFELPLLWTSRWVPNSNVLHLCSDSGMFFSNQQTATGMTCQDAVVGAPHQVTRIFTTAQFGYVSRPSGFWRASVGPLFAYDDNGTVPLFNDNGVRASIADTSLTLGFQAPIYLNIVSASDGKIGDYDGLIRIAPTIQWVESRTGWDTQMFITVSLLGQRNTFARALDWLQ